MATSGYPSLRGADIGFGARHASPCFQPDTFFHFSPTCGSAATEPSTDTATSEDALLAPDKDAESTATTLHHMPLSAETAALSQSSQALSSPFFLDTCAGAGAPLSTALQAIGVSTLAFDPLLDPSMDLRDDAVFDWLLRVCCSRTVALAHAAPPCGEYTRAKLLPNGPKALRTPAALDGLPGLTASQALKVQESQLVFTICVQALFLVFASGGQV